MPLLHCWTASLGEAAAAGLQSEAGAYKWGGDFPLGLLVSPFSEPVQSTRA